jgi:hypothetical protein
MVFVMAEDPAEQTTGKMPGFDLLTEAASLVLICPPVSCQQDGRSASPIFGSGLGVAVTITAPEEAVQTTLVIGSVLICVPSLTVKEATAMFVMIWLQVVLLCSLSVTVKITVNVPAFSEPTVTVGLAAPAVIVPLPSIVHA